MANQPPELVFIMCQESRNMRRVAIAPCLLESLEPVLSPLLKWLGFPPAVWWKQKKSLWLLEVAKVIVRSNGAQS